MTATTTRTAPTRRRAAAAAGTAVAVAASTSIVVLFAARIAGADMIVEVPGRAAMSVGVLHVIIVTCVAGIAGALVLLAVRRGAPRTWNAVALAGLVLGLVSAAAPLTVEAGTGTRAVLAAMHVATGVAWFTVLRRHAARTDVRDR